MRKRSKQLMLLVSFLGIVLGACQGSEESEYYGDLSDTPSGLVLEQTEHGLGWGQEICTTCHVPENYHRVRSDRTSGIDMDQIQAFVEQNGPDSCSICHGTNGVNLLQAQTQNTSR